MEEGLISVDKWTSRSQIYFLTHLHSDHTLGLTSKWTKGPLYCSEITARLIPVKFPGFDLSLIHILLSERPQIVTLVSAGSNKKVFVEVIAIDARHCPGAVMYLFRGEFGSMLYTGDFRWEVTDIKAISAKEMLFNALGGDKLDVLYLDNTYCNPLFSFPPRQVAAQQIVDIIMAHPNHDIIIGIDTLGKEDLLLHISTVLKTKIWVWPERLQIMDLLGFGDAFTTKACLTRVRAVPRYSFTVDTVESLNTVRPTIGILPTGRPLFAKSLKQTQFSIDSGTSSNQKCSDIPLVNSGPSEVYKYPRRLHQHIFSVSYSDHSCFSEIVEFVKHVNPSRISGIVSSSFCCINPGQYLAHLCTEGQIPKRSWKDARGKLFSSSPMKTGFISERKESRETDQQIKAHEEIKESKVRPATPKILGVQKSVISKIRRKMRGVKVSHLDS